MGNTGFTGLSALYRTPLLYHQVIGPCAAACYAAQDEPVLGVPGTLSGPIVCNTRQVSWIRSVCSACNHLVRLHLATCFSVASRPLSPSAHKLPGHSNRRATPSAARSSIV